MYLWHRAWATVWKVTATWTHPVWPANIMRKNLLYREESFPPAEASTFIISSALALNTGPSERLFALDADEVITVCTTGVLTVSMPLWCLHYYHQYSAPGWLTLRPFVSALQELVAANVYMSTESAIHNGPQGTTIWEERKCFLCANNQNLAMCSAIISGSCLPNDTYVVKNYNFSLTQHYLPTVHCINEVWLEENLFFWQGDNMKPEFDMTNTAASSNEGGWLNYQH